MIGQIADEYGPKESKLYSHLSHGCICTAYPPMDDWTTMPLKQSYETVYKMMINTQNTTYTEEKTCNQMRSSQTQTNQKDRERV